MLLQEMEDFHQISGLHDEAIAILKKTRFEVMAIIVFGSGDDISLYLPNGADGEAHALVIGAELAPIPRTTAGSADKKALGFCNGPNWP